MDGTLIGALIILVLVGVAYLIGHTHGAAKSAPTGSGNGGGVDAGAGKPQPPQPK